MAFKVTKGDIDAYFGVLFDGLPKILTGVFVLTPILGADVVFGELLPSIALGIMVASLFLYWFGEQQRKKTGDNTVCALPGGINAGRFFVFLFAIMIPTYDATGSASLAIGVGIGAHIISAIVSIIFAFTGEKLVKVIPSEALFGGLAGAALTWLALATFNDMFGTPIIAFTSIFIILAVFLAKIKIPVSPAVVSVVVGVIIGSLGGIITMAGIKEATGDFGFYMPGAMLASDGYFSMVKAGLVEALKYIPIIIVFSLGETVSNTQSLSQARSVGDEYPVTKALIGINVVSLISALLGNPFPFGLWWGYPSWKERKATTSYPILVGLTYLVLGSTGVIAIATAVIPLATVLPILVFIGLVSLQNAFADEDKKYYGIMAFALVIPIVEWGASIGENLGFLANGAMFVSLIWGSALIFIAKNNWNKVAFTFIVGGVLTFLGLMHTPDFILEVIVNSAGDFEKFGLIFNSEQFAKTSFISIPHIKYALMYLVAAVVSYIFYVTKVVKYEEEAAVE